MRLVKIDEKEFPYVFGMGALMIYESLMGKSLSLDNDNFTATQLVAIHYACLCNGGAEFSSSVAEFTQKLDDPKLVVDLRGAFMAELERWRSRNSSEDDGDDESANDGEKSKKN